MANARDAADDQHHGESQIRLGHSVTGSEERRDTDDFMSDWIQYLFRLFGLLLFDYASE